MSVEPILRQLKQKAHSSPETNTIVLSSSLYRQLCEQIEHAPRALDNLAPVHLIQDERTIMVFVDPLLAPGMWYAGKTGEGQSP